MDAWLVADGLACPLKWRDGELRVLTVICGPACDSVTFRGVNSFPLRGASGRAADGSSLSTSAGPGDQPREDGAA